MIYVLIWGDTRIAAESPQILLSSLGITHSTLPFFEMNWVRDKETGIYKIKLDLDGEEQTAEIHEVQIMDRPDHL